MFKRALVSTSDKTGLIEFLAPLAQQGCEIVSTGGTSKFLRDNGIKVREVGEVTGFPEMMDGRVRTLHPKIHMGLLARSHVADDMKLLEEHGVAPFDLVVVNLYPFEQSYQKGLRGDELIEQIDIGGPSLLRAAAKSFERVTVTCDPADYPALAEAARAASPLSADQKRAALALRHKLAVKVFEHTSFYDSIVARGLALDADQVNPSWVTAKTVTLPLRAKSGLRYGENPHQKAVWFESPFRHPLSLCEAQQVQGKELSYNNILDLEAAVSVVADFNEPACGIIKHLSPCGVSVDRDITSAYKRAFEADSISAFGGIVALNRPVDGELAKAIVEPFLECVIAPGIDDAALKVLSAKKNLRVLVLPNLVGINTLKVADEFEVKSLRGGALIQSVDSPSEWQPDWKITGAEPSTDVKADLIFAQKVVRHVKSNAIVIVKNRQTLGICGGQTNRVDSVKWALERAKNRGAELVLASDAFFPFRDSIDLAARGGVRWIIQPGGSLRDAEVAAAVAEHKIGMVVTSKRHFKH